MVFDRNYLSFLMFLTKGVFKLAWFLGYGVMLVGEWIHNTESLESHNYCLLCVILDD